MKPGKLYLVATPIGNLEDISLRALRILRQVPRIACEDTRHSERLLRHYEITTPRISFHRFNEHRVLSGILDRLLAGEDLALVTDGGTPSISDPGFSLVRAAAERGIEVVPIPGPSALLSALIASGLPAERFLFLGFLPHRSTDRKKLFGALRQEPHTLVLFDSPRRVRRSLEEMASILGNRRAALCREMTKVHEEFRRGRLEELAHSLAGGAIKGEVTLVVEGAPESTAPIAPEVDLREEVERAIGEGLSRRDAVRQVAEHHGVRRREVYRLARRAADANPVADDSEE